MGIGVIRVLVCGSSHRKGGSGGWTDETWLDGVLRALEPDLLAHGASPSGGGDAVAEACGVRHFRERGLDPDQHVRRFPMDPALDGHDRGRFMARNTRMGRTFFPGVTGPLDYVPLGIALCVGRVGQAVGTRGHYLSNGTDDMTKWLGAHGVPTVVRREDGVEPDPTPQRTMRLLYERTRDELLGASWLAINALRKGETSREEVLAALGCARERSRWAPWIEAVERTVAREQTPTLAG